MGFVVIVGFALVVLWIAARSRLVFRLHRDAEGVVRESDHRLPARLRREVLEVLARARYRGTVAILRQGERLRARARPPLSAIAGQQLDNVLGQFHVDRGVVRERFGRSNVL